MLAAFRRARANLPGPSRIGRYLRRAVRGNKDSLEPTQTVEDVEIERQAAHEEPVQLTADGLRSRLASLGSTFTIEVAPGDVIPGDAAKENQGFLELQAQARADGNAASLQPGCHVYVNMVKMTMSHFDQVVGASKALARAGFTPVAHVPAARFQDATDFEDTLSSLVSAGVRHILVLGGNDLGDRVSVGSCVFECGAQSVLQSEIDFLKSRGIVGVALAGHPDGIPALGCDEERTRALLLAKARLVLEAGLQLTITTQFCFDAHKLVRWLKRTRQDMFILMEELRDCAQRLPGTMVEEESPVSSSCPVSFHIGLPGPTSQKKLERIAKLCDVPSQFVHSAYDAVKGDADDYVSLPDLENASEFLRLSRQRSKLRSLYTKHATASGALGRQEFALLLAEDAMYPFPAPPVDVPPSSTGSQGLPAERAGMHASGPSVFVSSNPGCDLTTTSPAITMSTPEELVIALAAFCECERTAPGEVALHFFPFGGLARTLELTSKLRDGLWPVTDELN